MANATFTDAIQRGGIVTVMNAAVLSTSGITWNGLKTPEQAYAAIASCPVVSYINHFKTANLNASGPTITITGGQDASPLIKFGKTMKCEMQMALCQIDALEALGGVETTSASGKYTSYTVTNKFPGPVTIVGDTFVVDQKTGDQLPVKIIIYQFLPDAVFNLTQDASNAATFDLNGDVLGVRLASGIGAYHGTSFYTILDGSASTAVDAVALTPAVDGVSSISSVADATKVIEYNALHYKNA
jgi:hypothetical protein